jgi:hypothetical protein
MFRAVLGRDRDKVYRVSRAILPGMSGYVTAKIGIRLLRHNGRWARAALLAPDCPVYPNRDPAVRAERDRIHSRLFWRIVGQRGVMRRVTVLNKKASPL